MSENSVIICEDVYRNYKLGKTWVEVLRGVNLEIGKGEKVFLCGASGAGKTTLMYSMAGLERPEKGRVFIDGVDLYSLSRGAQSSFRNDKLGYIFQNYFLLPELTALENVMIPGMIAQNEVKERAEELLEAVGLSHRKDHLPAELSGGESQRVAIARSMVNNPQILFADEPTGNLDSKNGEEIIEILFKLSDSSQTTLVIVTHDQELAKRGDRLIQIRDGKVV